MANTKVIVIPEGKICDYIDSKFRNDTPEEYVRQTIEKRLVNEHKYLPKQIKIEYTLQLGSRKPRADIVIFDRDCSEQTQENIKIEYIASHSNRFKTYTMNLINAEDADGSAYRESIAKLHGALLNAAITTQEYIGVRQAVSFAEVAVKNANTLKRKDYNRNRYECSRAHGKTKTVVTVRATGVSVFSFEQEGYDIDVLRQQSGFIALTTTQKAQCEECYQDLTPYRTTSVLETGENKKQIGAYNFVNDAGKISEAIVIILYMLRCCLAHGDISPDESANEVYKFAYEVLCAPLKKLK